MHVCVLDVQNADGFTWHFHNLIIPGMTSDGKSSTSVAGLTTLPLAIWVGEEFRAISLLHWVPCRVHLKTQVAQEHFLLLFRQLILSCNATIIYCENNSKRKDKFASGGVWTCGISAGRWIFSSTLTTRPPRTECKVDESLTYAAFCDWDSQPPMGSVLGAQELPWHVQSAFLRGFPLTRTRQRPSRKPDPQSARCFFCHNQCFTLSKLQHYINI